MSDDASVVADVARLEEAAIGGNNTPLMSSHSEIRNDLAGFAMFVIKTPCGRNTVN